PDPLLHPRPPHPNLVRALQRPFALLPGPLRDRAVRQLDSAHPSCPPSFVSPAGGNTASKVPLARHQPVSPRHPQMEDRVRLLHPPPPLVLEQRQQIKTPFLEIAVAARPGERPAKRDNARR